MFDAKESSSSSNDSGSGGGGGGKIRAWVREQVTDHIWFTLLPHQRDAIVFAIEHQGRALISHEQGLGKTLIAETTALLVLRDSTPALFITTTSNTHNMKNEAVQRLYIPLALIQHLKTSKTKINPAARLVIVSHGLAVRMCTELLAHKFRNVVVDEAHIMKNHESQTSIALTKLLHQADKCRLLLTGTPMDGRHRDLFAPIRALYPHMFSSFFEFARLYCKPHQVYNASEQKYYWRYDGNSRQRELTQLLQTQIMHRRLKEDVLADLPPKERLRVDLVVNNEESKQEMRTEIMELDKLIKKYREQQQQHAPSRATQTSSSAAASLPSPSPSTSSSMHDFFTQAKRKRKRGEAEVGNDDDGGDRGVGAASKKRKYNIGSSSSSSSSSHEDVEAHAAAQLLATGPDFDKLACDKELGNIIRGSLKKFKIPSVVSYVKQLLKSMKQQGNTDKVLLFAHHKIMCKAIARRVLKSGFKFITIDGTVKPDDRAERVKRFQTMPDVRVAVLSIDACGAAINLFAANVVVMTEIRFSALKHSQAEDRAHRMGQTRPVQVLYLVLQGSIDERIYTMLQAKINSAAGTLDNKPRTTTKA